ncbi:PepSY domain-containing protein [Streptomyces flavidovirens]
MKRKLVIATAVTALLIGGGTATAFATSDAPTTSAVTLDEATAAAVKSTPGKVTGAELDDDRPTWEIDVYGKDAKWHDVDVDAKTAKVQGTHTEDDEDDRAPKDTKVTMSEAAKAALKAQPGTLTSIDLDDDGTWEAEVQAKDGKEHELTVNATTAKVTADQPDADDADDDNDSD